MRRELTEARIAYTRTAQSKWQSLGKQLMSTVRRRTLEAVSQEALSHAAFHRFASRMARRMWFYFSSSLRIRESITRLRKAAEDYSQSQQNRPIRVDIPTGPSINFVKMPHIIECYRRQVIYNNLIAAYNSLCQKREMRRAERLVKWHFFSRRLQCRDLRHRCEKSLSDWHCRKSHWTLFSSHLSRRSHGETLARAHERNREERERIVGRLAALARRFISRKVNESCENAVHAVRQKSIEKASAFGAAFVMRAIPGLEAIVDDAVRPTFAYERTLPVDFWRKVGLFAFTQAQRYLHESLNLAIATLSSEASQQATTFVNWQTVLSHCRMPGLPEIKRSGRLSGENQHFIVVRRANDLISLLG